jgi:hypothetical protein
MLGCAALVSCLCGHGARWSGAPGSVVGLAAGLLGVAQAGEAAEACRGGGAGGMVGFGVASLVRRWGQRGVGAGWL